MLMILYGEVIVFFVALFFAALFAFLETSFTALRLFKVKELEIRVSRYKNLFRSWEENPQRILITILIANNFAHVTCSVFITEIMQHMFGDYGLAVGVAIATVMILIFGEIIPKSFAKAHHERIFTLSLSVIHFLYWALHPIVTVLLKIIELFPKKIGAKLVDKSDEVSEKEIEFLIDYSDEKGLIEAEKGEMLQNIFDLGQTPVNKIMIPKSDIISLDVSSSLEDSANLFYKHYFSRLPVYDDKEDNILGMIRYKDVTELISKNKKKSLKDILYPVLFVPEAKKCNQLLSEFLKKRMHMAIIIDEYGSVIGLVTLEDIIEEIVGEIRDEHEKVHTEITSLEKDRWLIDAKTSLENVEELLNITFPDKGMLTLSGFLSDQLQHLPKKGERIIYKDYCFQIQQASPRRVFQVLVFREKEDPGFAEATPGKKD